MRAFGRSLSDTRRKGDARREPWAAGSVVAPRRCRCEWDRAVCRTTVVVSLSQSALLSSLSAQLPSRTPRLPANLAAPTRASPAAELSLTVPPYRPQAPQDGPCRPPRPPRTPSRLGKRARRASRNQVRAGSSPWRGPSSQEQRPAGRAYPPLPSSSDPSCCRTAPQATAWSSTSR